MSIASNQYAAKIFSEHPIAVWPLDDEAHYLSLISDEERDISLWTLTNCSVTLSPTLPDTPSPFEDDADYYGIIGDSTELSATGGVIELKSTALFMFDSLNENLKNFAINFYLYQESPFAISYEFGFKYFDTFLGADKEVLVEVDAPPVSSWIRLGETFDVPEFDSDTCEIILRITVAQGGSSGDYNFIVNALSVGQWSEPFSAKTLGSTASLIPSVLESTNVYGIQADQYGPLSEYAYYISENGRLLAKNTGVPLIFGSENSVKLEASETSLPSFIFPSKGFLYENGKNNVKTLEFWMRIKPNTKNNRRIFGPINSDSGVYVSEGLLTLALGDNFQCYNIYEWYRPMLIHIVYNETNCQMYINGEIVIDFEINKNELAISQNQDWLAFFSYDDIELFEIDCISIFPYAVPVQVAKRRFVWGQGSGSQEVIDNSFKGSSTSFAFSNSEYSSTIIYPDKERWDAGYYNNMLTTRTSLTVPNFSLPEIFLNGRDEKLWYNANKLINELEYPGGNHPRFITFRPNTNNAQTQWLRTGPNWNEKGYLQFSTTNIASAPISAFFSIFEIEDDIETDRPLIHIVNGLNGKRFEININSYTVSYIFNDQELWSVDTSGQSHIVVGIHIPTIVQRFGSELSAFFSSYDSLQIYVGGAPDTQSNTYGTFEGKIYRVSFSDSSNYNEISQYFNDDGIVNYDEDELFIGHYSTYTLSPFLRYGKFYLDVSISASWEEYYPLSLFAKYVIDSRGNSSYELDYMQFNVGYPSYIEKTLVSSVGTQWQNYLEIENFFSYPVQKSYEIIDNESITGYANYAELQNNSVSEIILDTSKSCIDISATFQLVSEGANQVLTDFPYTKELTQSMTVDAAAESTPLNIFKPYKTKFKIIDGTIIYPPKNIKFENVALALYFSIKKDSVIKHPLTIRDMNIFSRSLNSRQPNPIGTKFGKNVYPYIKRGIYFDYKSKNPISIYNKNTPYLYLTENSGIKVLNYNEFNNENTVAVPINESQQREFNVGAVQLFIKFDTENIIQTVFPLFEIQYKTSTIEFVGQIDSSTLRTRMFARDKFTKQQYSQVVFYQNGVQTDTVFLEKNHWSAIGLVFLDSLDFSSFSGSLNLFSGARFENISYYLSEGLNEIDSIVPRSWQKVLTEDNVSYLDWQYWYDENGNSAIKKWKDVYVLTEEQLYSLDASDIYKSYLGTNINVIDDGGGINVLNDDFYIFSNVLWSSTVGKPA